jgi:phosphoglycolate phosphatase
MVVLFDVDGTLLDAGGAGVLAMRRACVAIFGGTDGLAPERRVAFAGRTDPAILADMAREAGHTLDAASERLLTARYLAELPRALTERGARPLPGVEGLLRRLAGEGRCRLALGTGNLAAGALAKLRSVALERFFRRAGGPAAGAAPPSAGALVGGFGDGHRERAPVIGEALQCCRRAFGEREAEAVVVGDAVADVEAARAHGLRVLAVATGSTPPEDLAAAAPDLLLPDLRDTERVVAWLLGAP